MIKILGLKKNISIPSLFVNNCFAELIERMKSSKTPSNKSLLVYQYTKRVLGNIGSQGIINKAKKVKYMIFIAEKILKDPADYCCPLLLH